jgi:hypothetical protein
LQNFSTRDYLKKKKAEHDEKVKEIRKIYRTDLQIKEDEERERERLERIRKEDEERLERIRVEEKRRLREEAEVGGCGNDS